MTFNAHDINGHIIDLFGTVSLLMFTVENAVKIFAMAMTSIRHTFRAEAKQSSLDLAK